jgi:putative oxidoreductase
LITLGIALVLLLWSLIAISGSGALPMFPFLKLSLCLITAIYLLRGVAGFLMLVTPVFSRQKLTSTFLIISSLICLVYGVVHLVGLVQVWDRI